MAIKKSDLYSSLWASCDELRGRMDASQYKDYVLVLLFIKYISDKYAGQPYAAITVPKGASFKDMVALKGKPDIGDQINKKIIAPIANENKLSDMPDFYDANKLGSGKEMVDLLTNLIAIFENPALDFSKNRAEGDDIIGDAYEYLMRHFATESGKSKGQFYTPAEVSRVMAQIICIQQAKTSAATTVYDPTCGSGSLLLKVADWAGTEITLYGQEKDSTTSGLARMNMILHNYPTALIHGGQSTVANPNFKDGDSLKTFDFVVANPPFSDKRWSTGFDPLRDPFERFNSYGVPPAKQGDYAYLLHIVRSLKSTGKGACILPHGVLFRGHAEAQIRRNLVRKGYIKGIIGLPANLFYGTGIPACIVVIDKEDAPSRRGIFMVDASKGFMKDGPKNRLRSQDIHKIVDAFNKQTEIEKYSRMVSFDEIEKNEFNLNLPRYIDSQIPEDLQDIEGHLKGGIPKTDIEALNDYWEVCPQLAKTLFKQNRPGYFDLAVDTSQFKVTISEHKEFQTFISNMNAHFETWKKRTAAKLKTLEAGCHPKEVIYELSEGLLAHYSDQPLINHYDVYQHLMDYWAETMQDDCYLIGMNGWKAEITPIYRVIASGKKKGKEKQVGWVCDMIPKELVVAHYFFEEQNTLDQLGIDLETATASKTELEEENGGDGGALDGVSKKSDAQWAWAEALLAVWQELKPKEYQNYTENEKLQAQMESRRTELESNPAIQNLKNDKGNITKGAISKRLKETKDSAETKILKDYIESTTLLNKAKKKAKSMWGEMEQEMISFLDQGPEEEAYIELKIIREWLKLDEEQASLKEQTKEADSELENLVLEKYPKLTEDEIKTLVVEDKWMAELSKAIHGEMGRVSQALTQRVNELAERYETPLPKLAHRVAELEFKVNCHLEKMGFNL